MIKEICDSKGPNMRSMATSKKCDVSVIGGVAADSTAGVDSLVRHEEYSEFRDTLQDERFFKRSKKPVIQRPEFQANTCRLTLSSVFPAEPPVLQHCAAAPQV